MTKSVRPLPGTRTKTISEPAFGAKQKNYKSFKTQKNTLPLARTAVQQERCTPTFSISISISIS
jgi:hypothetical protein